MFTLFVFILTLALGFFIALGICDWMVPTRLRQPQAPKIATEADILEAMERHPWQSRDAVIAEIHRWGWVVEGEAHPITTRPKAPAP